MKRKFAAFALSLAFAGPVIAQDDHVAMFKTVSGNVKILRHESEVIPVAGTQVMRMDTLVSAAGASAAVVFNDGTALTVGPSTEIEISRYMFRPDEAKYDFAVFLKKGSAIYSSGKLGKLAPDAVKVSTPRATVGVRGTRFIIKDN